MAEARFAEYFQKASAWALDRVGNETYAGRCLAFVEDAYEQANGVEIFGGSTARESAESYGAQASTGEPPAGAFVFYDCRGPLHGETRNWGHVGLCLGDGRIVHAMDRVRVDPYLDVWATLPGAGWSAPEYLGWAPVERIFAGYRTTDGGDL